MTFVLATVLAVAGGMLYMMYMRSTEPGIWNLGLSLNILAAVVIGGSKSIWGVGIGTFFIFAFDDIVLRNIPFFVKYGNATYIINGILIIVVVMFYPGGIVKLFTDIYRSIKTLFIRIKTSWREYKYGKDI